MSWRGLFPVNLIQNILNIVLALTADGAGSCFVAYFFHTLQAFLPDRFHNGTLVNLVTGANQYIFCHNGFYFNRVQTISYPLPPS